MNNNPSPGNKAGGLTTILEKSLGAVAKGGTTNLVDVYEYAEPVTAKGFVYMDTPGYDPVSATGQVAGGANMIVFTTGRGSAYGCAPSPSLKLSTNTALWVRQEEDIDLNCGEIVDGGATVDGDRRAAVPVDARHGVGREIEERAARLRPERVRAVVRGRGDVIATSVARLTRPEAARTLQRRCGARSRGASRQTSGMTRRSSDESRHEVRRGAARARHAGASPRRLRRRRRSSSGGSRASTSPRTTRCSRRSRSSRRRPASRSTCRNTPVQDMIPKTVAALDAGNAARRRVHRRLRLPGHRQVGVRRQARGHHRRHHADQGQVPARTRVETTYLYNDKTKKRAYYAFPIKQQTMHIEYWKDMLAEAGFKDTDDPDDVEGVLGVLVRQGAAATTARRPASASSAPAFRWASIRATRSTRS